jgi:hypothetical protein
LPFFLTVTRAGGMLFAADDNALDLFSDALAM